MDFCQQLDEPSGLSFSPGTCGYKRQTTSLPVVVLHTNSARFCWQKCCSQVFFVHPPFKDEAVSVPDAVNFLPWLIGFCRAHNSILVVELRDVVVRLLIMSRQIVFVSTRWKSISCNMSALPHNPIKWGSPVSLLDMGCHFATWVDWSFCLGMNTLLAPCSLARVTACVQLCPKCILDID